MRRPGLAPGLLLHQQYINRHLYTHTLYADLLGSVTARTLSFAPRCFGTLCPASGSAPSKGATKKKLLSEIVESCSSVSCYCNFSRTGA